MNKLFNEIFQLYPPYSVAVGNDDIALYLNAIGNFLIGITFIIIGILCLAKAASAEKTRRRVHLSRMFGLFILTCGLARFVDLLSLWYNYAIINGILKICTGLMACIALLYVPKVIKEIKESVSMDNIRKKLDITVERIEQLTQTQKRGNE